MVGIIVISFSVIQSHIQLSIKRKKKKKYIYILHSLRELFCLMKIFSISYKQS